MRTIYERAIRSAEFLRLFAESNADVLDMTQGDGERWLDIPLDDVASVIRSCTVYSVSNLRRLYEASEGASFDDTYPQRVACIPPSKSTWIEAPSFDPTVDVHPFFYVRDTDNTTIKPRDCERVVLVLCFMMARGEFFREGMCVLRLDEHGCSTHPMVGYRANGSDAESRMLRFTLMATYFLAFLNCRNIDVVEHQPSRQARRSAERSKEAPPITYRTVEIASVGRTEIGRPRSLGADAMPRHLCRGHFKRYTADRPLLGKHVGQYWWDQHARGSAERGVVFKDYAVDVAP